MQSISAVIITLNEEKNIERCIRSVQPFADEVVVIDSHSTDRTKEISLGLEAKVHEKEWQGYAGSKNIGNELASFDYIFSIDADEEVSEELRLSILNEKEKGLRGAYVVNRLSNYCGSWIRHSGWYPDRKTRLFNKNQAKWTGDLVHETLELDPNVEQKKLNGDLFHYTINSAHEHFDLIEKYSGLEAEKNFKAGKRAGFVKLYLSPLFKFFQSYFLQLGFLDGSQGFNVCWRSAIATKRKYQKLKQLEKESKNQSGL